MGILVLRDKVASGVFAESPKCDPRGDGGKVVGVDSRLVLPCRGGQ